MDWQQTQKELLSRLSTLYETREAAVITDWVMEHLSGWKKIDRILHKSDSLSPAHEEQLKKYTQELLEHRPVQYVLQESWFCGMKFYVDEAVLIPRPETEELVDWIVGHHSSVPRSTPSILDVGTGSGCIAISLKKKLPAAKVYACDLSEKALAIAQRNAASLGTDLHLLPPLDFLDDRQWENLPVIDCLVSNPPYIPLAEKATMAPHVTRFEPHLALFVEDGDPLIFYRALADFAQRKLTPGGSIFAEMHEELAAPVAELFKNKGLEEIVVKKDMQGKDRMISARKPF